MGKEFSAKGVDMQLGPVAGPLGRSPEGGRNWEGFSPDPVNTGTLMAETVKGMQDAGVIACAKHFIGNEQEHFRMAGEAQGYGYNITQAASSNIDDKTMHELYLWYVRSLRCRIAVANEQAICGCRPSWSRCCDVFLHSNQQQLRVCKQLYHE